MDKQIVKSNHVIEASYRLTLNEQRLILLCIQQIKKGQAITAESAFLISAADVSKAYNVTTDRAYVLLQEVVDKLYERSLTIYKPDPELPQKQTKTRWITAIDYLENEGRVYLYFAPKVIPYISLLESGFTRYNLEYIAPMTSVYGVRFYELFKCWLMGDKSKVKSINLDELKSLLDIKGQYASIKDFKFYVLDRGIEDVNQHTDLAVSYENTRTGRKITGLDFTINVKQQAKAIEAKPPKQPKTEEKTNSKENGFLSLEETKSRLEGARALAKAVNASVETFLTERDRASIAHYELTI